MRVHAPAMTLSPGSIGSAFIIESRQIRIDQQVKFYNINGNFFPTRYNKTTSGIGMDWLT
jgi:hypothetical protein